MKRIHFLIVFLFGLALFSIFLFPSSSKEIFFTSTSKFFASFRFLTEPLSNVLDFKTLNQLQKENEILEKENKRLKSRVFELEKFSEENKDLRKMLEAGEEEQMDLFFARVVFRNLNDNFIVINKGEKDGVKKEMFFISSEKELIGRVNKVFRGFSEVLLLSSQEVVVEGESSSGVLGQLQGKGNGELSLDLIVNEADLEEGETVYTRGERKMLPEGILVGKVKAVDSLDVEPYKSARVEWFVDPWKINNGFLIKDY